MTTLFKINVWKKGTNQYTSMPDYQIEITEGDTYKLTSLIESVTLLMEKMIEERGKEDEKV